MFETYSLSLDIFLRDFKVTLLRFCYFSKVRSTDLLGVSLISCAMADMGILG
jgi:hypothetical protein